MAVTIVTLIFREGSLRTAQGLDHNIFAQGPDIAEVAENFERAIVQHVRTHNESGRTGWDSLLPGAAAIPYFDLYFERCHRLTSGRPRRVRDERLGDLEVWWIPKILDEDFDEWLDGYSKKNRTGAEMERSTTTAYIEKAAQKAYTIAIQEEKCREKEEAKRTRRMVPLVLKAIGEALRSIAEAIRAGHHLK